MTFTAENNACINATNGYNGRVNSFITPQGHDAFPTPPRSSGLPAAGRTEEQTVALARCLARHGLRLAYMAAVREGHAPRENPFKPLPALQAPLPPDITHTETTP